MDAQQAVYDETMKRMEAFIKTRAWNEAEGEIYCKMFLSLIEMSKAQGKMHALKQARDFFGGDNGSKETD